MRNQLLATMSLTLGSLLFVPPVAMSGPLTSALEGPNQTAELPQGSDDDHLGFAQRSLLGDTPWSALSDEQKVVFQVITSYAESLGVNLAGFVLSSITIAGVDGETQTELNLASAEPGAAAVAVNDLESSLQRHFSSWPKAPMVGRPHSGYTGNFRQNVAQWSMQINTNVQTGAVQIDVDPFNPNSLVAPGHWFDVFRNKVTHSDTAYKNVAAALAKRGIKVAVRNEN
jgi:hypothetical protein